MNFDIFWTQFICRHALFCTRSHYVYFVSCIFSSSPIFWSSFSCCLLLLLFILTLFVYRCTCVRTVVTPRRSQRCTMSTSRSSTPSHPPSSSSTTSAISSLATAISPTCCSPAAETGSSHAAETGSSPAAETGSSPAAETGSSSCSWDRFLYLQLRPDPLTAAETGSLSAGSSPVKTGSSKAETCSAHAETGYSLAAETGSSLAAETGSSSFSWDLFLAPQLGPVPVLQLRPVSVFDRQQGASVCWTRSEDPFQTIRARSKQVNVNMDIWEKEIST